MTTFCINCGGPIADDNALACSNCGKPISKVASSRFDSSASSKSTTANARTSTSYISSTQTKSPFLALILSFFFTGLGQVYNGRFKKGIFFFFAIPIGYICLILPGFIIMIWGLWDAYSDSEKVNKGELPYAEPTAGEIIGYLCIYFGVQALLVIAIIAFYVFFVAMILAASVAV
jgi:TM2 domain-containing membrane protein YozV